jgi:hypothetical protein
MQGGAREQAHPPKMAVEGGQGPAFGFPGYCAMQVSAVSGVQTSRPV